MNLMPILFCYIFKLQVNENLTPLIQKIRIKKQQGSALRHQNNLNIKKLLALVLKKFVHVLFYVFQSNLNKQSAFSVNIRMDQKYTIDGVF